MCDEPFCSVWHPEIKSSATNFLQKSPAYEGFEGLSQSIIDQNYGDQETEKIGQGESGWEV